MDPAKRKTTVAGLSVISNATLVVLKLVAGLAIGSVSVISEAIHSGVDLLASAIAYFAVRTSGKPADERHPFGHGKLENISGTVEALLIFVAAGWIIYEAVKKILVPRPIDEPVWGILIMLISAGANLVVSHLLFKVGRQTGSIALEADAWHLRTDVYTSAGVMAGLGILWLGDRFAPHLGDWWHLLDPVAALVVAALIIKAAWHLTVESARDLMDVSLPEEEAEIRKVLRAFVPALHGFHRLRTRKSGPMIFIDFHIFVPSKMSVGDSHRLAHEVSEKIQSHFGGSSVTVHVEPCAGNCETRCIEGCLLTDAERQQMRRSRQFWQEP
jgi:cation diffusion facilitator family transporter